MNKLTVTLLVHSMLLVPLHGIQRLRTQLLPRVASKVAASHLFHRSAITGMSSRCFSTANNNKKTCFSKCSSSRAACNFNSKYRIYPTSQDPFQSTQPKPECASMNFNKVIYKAEEIKNAWGMSLSLDLHDCDPETIRSAEKIKQFVVELCDLIDMKRFGECNVVHFGEDEKVAGFSMTQLIETSLISAHFANATNTTYLDVFSCKEYDPMVVAKFAQEFFKAKNFTHNFVLRK